MSSTNIDYQIIHYQGDTFVLEFTYTDENNAPIDLADASAEMQIRRSPLHNKLVCQVTDAYPQGVFGISGSDFEYGYGTTGGTGGIILNYEGVTGSVYIQIDAETVGNIPAARHFYDMQITFNDPYEVKTILNGTFELAREVTR